jgi:glutamine---fructose-6-phosphate transaminase (isomerizing)
VGSDNASDFLLDGLLILRNRGYDSAGIATIPETGSELMISKYASRASTSDSIDLLRYHLPT